MKKKRIIVVSIVIVVISLIVTLWVAGVIPKQIAKVYGTIFMKVNFPEMNLNYVSLEWSKYHGNYIITFKDRNNQNYSCVIGTKYFPVNIGQGIFDIEETYREHYL